jgi:TolB protein
MTDLDRTSLDRIVPSPHGSPDWDDVMSRCHARGRRRRRHVLVLVAVLVILIGTASAVGGVRDFIAGGFIGLESDESTSRAPQTAEVVLDSSRVSATIAVVTRPRGNGVMDGTVWLVHTDGSGKRKLAGNAFSIAASPDGRMLAFVKAFNVTQETVATANFEIYVMNADGTGQRNLTRDPGRDGAPVWSPDGRKIAFVRGDLFVGDLYVMNADGSGQRKLADDAGEIAWSPDGRRLAFVLRDNEIYVMNADGSGQRRLTRTPAYEEHPAWSPDGRTIAFLRYVHPGGSSVGALYVMNADGSGQHRLALLGHSFPAPAWSPDGRRIAFTRGVHPNPKTSRYYTRQEVYVMNADGTGQRRLAYGTGPFWSPDGRKIAFVRSGPLIGGLYVMNADGSGQRRLARNTTPGWPQTATWLPGR